MAVTSLIAVAGASAGVAHASSDRVTSREATVALAAVADLLTDTAATSTSTAADAVVTDTVAIPRNASDGVDFSGLTVRLPGAADDAPAVKVDAGAVVYPSPGTHANAVQATEDGGFRALIVIENPNAPVEYRFAVTGATHLVANRDGTIDIHNLDTRVAVVAPAWARDRNQAPVPTEYRVEGTDIVQTVHHQHAAHPVVADPTFSWGWTGLTIHLSINETNSLDEYGGFGAAWMWKVPVAAGVLASYSGYAKWARARGACLRIWINYRTWSPVPSHYYGGNCK